MTCQLAWQFFKFILFVCNFWFKARETNLIDMKQWFCHLQVRLVISFSDSYFTFTLLSQVRILNGIEKETLENEPYLFSLGSLTSTDSFSAFWSLKITRHSVNY